MSSGEFASLSALLHFLRETPQDHFARVSFETDGKIVDNVVLENVPLWGNGPKATKPRIVVKRRKAS